MQVPSWVAAVVMFACLPVAAATLVMLEPDRPLTAELAPSETYEVGVSLRRGESAEVVVLQQGIDVIVDLLAQNDALLDSVDSPNGRQGEEPVSIFAQSDGAYRLRIRPIGESEPKGRVVVMLSAHRDERATRRLLESRDRAHCCGKPSDVDIAASRPPSARAHSSRRFRTMPRTDWSVLRCHQESAIRWRRPGRNRRHRQWRSDRHDRIPVT